MMQPKNTCKAPDGGYYYALLLDERYGRQDTLWNFPTRLEADNYGKAEAKKQGFAKYKVIFHYPESQRRKVPKKQ